jgi:hypothetical protein
MSALLGSCGFGKLRDGGYHERDLDGLARMELPDSLSRLATVGRAKDLRSSDGKGIRLLGDHSLDLEQTNFWAISHAFQMQGDAPKLRFVVSRALDVQSLASPAAYFEWCNLVFGVAAVQQLEWRSRKISKSVLLYEASWGTEPGKESAAWLLVDRERYLQAMIWGLRSAAEEGSAPKVLSKAAETYRLLRPLEDYFARVRQTLSEMAALRRDRYLDLLEALELEELDYAPTPKVVVFNQNLACQFSWRPFDNTGVPWDFAIVGRLGALRAEVADARWRNLYSGPAARAVFGLAPIGEQEWSAFVLGPDERSLPASRTVQVAVRTGWPQRGGDSFAYSGMEFRFDQPVPDLGVWLDDLEAATKAAAAAGLIEP